MNNSPVGAEVFHTSRRADKLTDMRKLIVTFRNFANAPKKQIIRQYSYSCVPGQCSRYRLDGLGFEPQQREDMSSSPKARSRLGGLLTHLFNGYRDYFRVCVCVWGGGVLAKRSCRDVDLSPPSSAAVKNEWGYNSTLAIRNHGV
jgi:hypothetical protein